MKWRHADMPLRMPQDKLGDFESEGGYIATLKNDGWRCLISWNGKELKFQSRRPMDKGGPTDHPISDSLKEEVRQFFVENEIPANTRLDSEWLCRRTEGDEEIVIFGVLYYNGEWVGQDPETVRWALVKSWKYNQPHVQLCPHTEENFEEFFQFHWDHSPKAEGIVLKQIQSKLIGNRKTIKKNPLWFKVKWRDGADGKSENTY